MNKPVLLLDMDGPMAAFDEGIIMVCDALGVKVDLTGLQDSNRKHYITDNMPDPDDAQMIRTIINTTHFFDLLPVTQGAQEGVELLYRVFDVWVCTKPLDVNPYCRDDKMAWIKRNFPELKDKVIMAPKKSLVRGDILLDDAPDLACSINASWTPVVFDLPYNRVDSQWQYFNRWTWGDPLLTLTNLL